METGVSEVCVFSTCFRAFVDGKPIIKRVDLVGAKDMTEAYAMAQRKQEEFRTAYERGKAAGRRKFKVVLTEKVREREWEALDELTDRIKEAEAHSPKGIAIKLAICCVHEQPFLDEPMKSLVQSAYRAAAQLGNYDPASEAAEQQSAFK